MIAKPTRRGLITGLAAIIAAPAVVRYESLMRVQAGDGLSLNSMEHPHGGMLSENEAWFESSAWVSCSQAFSIRTVRTSPSGKLLRVITLQIGPLHPIARD